MQSVTFDGFAKLDIRIGKVLAAEKIEGTDKLLKLEVDFGEKDEAGLPAGLRLRDRSDSRSRQVVSGIAQFYQSEDLIGKQFPFILNLEPRIIKGVESQGMILAVDAQDKIVLLSPDKETPVGSVIR